MYPTLVSKCSRRGIKPLDQSHRASAEDFRKTRRSVSPISPAAFGVKVDVRGTDCVIRLQQGEVRFVDWRIRVHEFGRVDRPGLSETVTKCFSCSQIRARENAIEPTRRCRTQAQPGNLQSDFPSQVPSVLDIGQIAGPHRPDVTSEAARRDDRREANIRAANVIKPQPRPSGLASNRVRNNL